MPHSLSILFVVVKFTQSLGASEDLVVNTAVEMSSQGHPPAFWFNFRPPESDWRIQKLRTFGCRIYFHDPIRRFHRTARLFFPERTRTALQRALAQALRFEAPSKVILNQGGNSDASAEAFVLQKVGIPYAVLSHSATESTWPDPAFLPAMRSIFLGARQCLFVSGAIRELTEAQLGMLLPRCEIVYNPCKFSTIHPCAWPHSSNMLSLASVSRLENKSKGIDILLRTLALPQWQRRPLSVTIYGEGPHRGSLESYSRALGLDSVCFAGYVGDIRSIWPKHHGFIQMSRYEGYGLSLVEAMFCQRMAISTCTPSALEFIREGETGFLAHGSSVQELSGALERAWLRRDAWRKIGIAASLAVEKGYPKQPIADFLGLIQHLS